MTTSFVDNAIDLPWLNFLSPEFETKFHREVPKFLYNTMQEASMQKPNSIRSVVFFYRTPACVRRIDRQTDARS